MRGRETHIKMLLIHYGRQLETLVKKIKELGSQTASDIWPVWWFVVSEFRKALLNSRKPIFYTSMEEGDFSFHKCLWSSFECPVNRKSHTVRFGSEKGLFVFWAWRSRSHGEQGACEYFLRVRPDGGAAAREQTPGEHSFPVSQGRWTEQKVEERGKASARWRLCS